jgi:hypothetical protein
MALIDQEDKGKKENSKESFITNFNTPLFACFYATVSKLHYFCLSIIGIFSKIKA